MSNQHPDDVKAAVLAALLAGQSISQVAREYSIPVGTVKRWSAARDDLVRPDEPQKKEIGDLLMDYLRANLETLQAQTVVFRDRVWLQQQNAADAAVLHGVMTDKAIRLLEAMSKANVTDDSPTAG